MPTITDVAERAAVSKSTVSRVLNGLPVKEETRLRVLAAIEDLDYIPNAQARGLTSGKTNLVGVVVPYMGSPFYGPILDGCHRTLWSYGFNMMVCSTYNRQGNEWELSKMLWEKRVDGMLILTPREIRDKPMQKFLRETAKSGFPIVVADGQIEHSRVSCVCVDNFQGGYEATRHLLELGHRQIGLVLGIADTAESIQRLDGYKKALYDWGIPFDPNKVWDTGAYSYEAGKKLAPQLLNPNLTAVFIASDDIAVGVMEVWQEYGVRIPDDLSIIGYDDLDYAEMAKPKLTTIRQPLTQLGEIGARKLVWIITDEEPDNTLITLQTELVIRDSTASPGGLV